MYQKSQEPFAITAAGYTSENPNNTSIVIVGTNLTGVKIYQQDNGSTSKIQVGTAFRSGNNWGFKPEVVSNDFHFILEGQGFLGKTVSVTIAGYPSYDSLWVPMID